MAAPLQQPNIQNLTAGLDAVSHEVGLGANIPIPLDIGQQLGDINNTLANMQGTLNNINKQVNNLSGKVDNLSGKFDNLSGKIDNLSGQAMQTNARLDRLPLLFTNSALSLNSPLRLPQPIEPAPPGAGPLPPTAGEILRWTSRRINGALIALGVDFNPNDNVDTRRALLADSLGCPQALLH